MRQADRVERYMVMALDEVHEYGTTEVYGKESGAALQEALTRGFLEKRKEGRLRRLLRSGLPPRYRLTVAGENWYRSNRTVREMS